MIAGYTRGKGRRQGTLGSLVLGDVRGRRARLRRERRHRLQRPRDRPAPEEAEAARARDAAVPGRSEDAARAQGRRRLGRAEARRRGRVRRVDARRAAARARVQGPARGQGGRPRCGARSRSRSRPRSARASASSSRRTWTSPSGPTRGSPRATCSRTTARVAPVLVPHLKDRPFTHEALPRRLAGQVLLPEGRAEGDAGLDSDGVDRRLDAGQAAAAPADRRAARQRRARAALDGEHGLHRPEHVVLADRQARPAGLRCSSTSTPHPTSGSPETIQVALLVKQALDTLELRELVKTSGSEGIHILVPIARRHTYADTREFSAIIAERARAHAPRARHDRVDEGEAPRRADRLEPERRGEDDRVGLLGAPEGGRAGLDAAALGRGERVDSTRPRSRWTRCSRRVEKHGDLFAGVLTTKQSLTAALKTLR